MRWMIGAAVLAVAVGAWAQEKPAGQTLDDPATAIRTLEREELATHDRVAAAVTRIEAIQRLERREKDVDKHNALLQESQALNDQRNVEQIRLNELREQLRVRRSQQLRQAFGDECDLYLADLAGPTQAVAGVRLVGVVDVDGRRLLQFRAKGGGPVWTVDAQRIVMARVTIPAQENTKTEKQE